jgi:shikimate dehydrogenase
MIPTHISGTTSLCLIIGDPVSHSLTPRMHNAGYSALQLDYCMAAAHVREADLKSAMAGVRALSVRALSVTMPHKIALCPLVDILDPVAATIGAINTVVNTEGSLTGYNTDWLGILRPLEKRLSLQGRRVAVLGAGGAAQAAAYACCTSGASVTILNRSSDKAMRLARAHDCSWGALAPSTDMEYYDVVINTTPVGMGQLRDQSPMTASQFRSHHLVFETIYDPRETLLLRHAQAAGCTIIRGEEMFLEQGAAQFELHTGQVAPRDAMQHAIRTRDFANL